MWFSSHMISPKKIIIFPNSLSSIGLNDESGYSVKSKDGMNSDGIAVDVHTGNVSSVFSGLG